VPPIKDRPLNAPAPTQRRLVLALVVTVVCVPLLALEVLSSAGGAVEAQTSLRTDGPAPSLVVAAVPSTEDTTTTSTVAAAPESRATTAAPVAPTTSTTAKPRPSTTSTTRAPTTTTTRPAPAPTPPPAVSNTATWDALANCETGGNWAMNTGNGYSGGLQFHSATWLQMGGAQYAPAAWMASREAQIAVGERVRAAVGFSAWPGCARKLGLS